MQPNSFVDAYFGEIVALAKDVAKAPGMKSKLLYIIMPPGWSHTGDHKMASTLRRKFLELSGADTYFAASSGPSVNRM